MSLWGNLDAANNAPLQGGTSGVGLTANTQQLYGNTTVATVNSTLGVAGQAIGAFGVDAQEQTATAAQGGHAGWVIRKVGTGGRAGRIQVETLVAMGSMTGDGSEDTFYPDTLITITTQPQSNSAFTSGENLTLSVIATSTNPDATLTYQWYDVANGALLASNTATTLNVTAVTANSSYNVRVSSTGANTVGSDTATITVV
jgi:hypothetical protein